MGCTVRGKHIRANRRSRSVKPETEQNNSSNSRDRVSLSKTLIESGIINEPQPKLSLNSNPTFDDNDWSYCTEEQLEDILLKNLDFLYNEALSKLIALGYDEDTALKAVLSNGHCYGGMDVLTNVLHNSLAYLNSGVGGSSSNVEGPEVSFVNLRQLEEYSLSAMVCLLQQVKPYLTRGDAMWCLLMRDLHVGCASMMEIPTPPSGSCHGCGNPSHSKLESDNSGDEVGLAPALCKFHRGCDMDNGPNGDASDFPVDEFLSFAAETCLQREIDCPERFNLSPSMKSLLKKNGAAFAAGFRSKSERSSMQSQSCASALPNGNSSGVEVLGEQNKEAPNVKNLDVLSTLLSKFDGLNLEEMENVPEDQKDEMIMSLMSQVKDLERQVKERKEWAQEKAMQAARKLSNDLTELKTLRMEREETQRLKKGKQTLKDSTLKRLSEMENALRKASGQVDRANSAVRRLETENAEIRAEMEASKLSASESVITCLEIAKREKKCLKRLLAWEMQKAKMQEQISVARENISERQQLLVKIEVAQKDFEAKWNQEQKAKKLAASQLEEERRLKEAAEANNKRNLESLRLKTDIDFQRHKDDLLRLEHELSQLKSSALCPHSTDTVPFTRPQGETIAQLLREFEKWEDSEREGTEERECMLCLKDEVSVVFLPCAHQVLCSSCNENYGKKGRAMCPCCRVLIEQRIRVFGASS